MSHIGAKGKSKASERILPPQYSKSAKNTEAYAGAFRRSLHHRGVGALRLNIVEHREQISKLKKQNFVSFAKCEFTRACTNTSLATFCYTVI